MSHVPHLLLPPPWGEERITLDPSQRHHLERVLRRRPGGQVTYTDGCGIRGEGILDADSVRRGAEVEVPPPRSHLTLAVAPPSSRERQRFVVEKLAELGARRLVWLSTRRTEGRPPRADKARAWAAAALEQSRGTWILEVGPTPVPLEEAPPPLFVAHPGGGPVPSGLLRLSVAVGPEGGFAPSEIPRAAGTVGLGDRILRVETAAVAVAARILIS